MSEGYFVGRDFEKINKNNFIKKINKKKLFFFGFFVINFFYFLFFKIPSYKIFKIYQGTFPKSLRSLAQKMKEEIDFK